MNAVDPNLVEKGNTQKGVNLAIITELRNLGWPMKRLLDIPCGQGEFLRSALNIDPNVSITGQDLYSLPLPEIKNFFIKKDVSDWSSLKEMKFDVITCISGVMVFDNITGLFDNANRHLRKDGLFVITNDNILTIRDRLSFLFFGRTRRFKMLYSQNEGNWNIVLIQGLWKLFRSNGFELVKIRYVSYRYEDIVFLPLAILAFPLHLAYLAAQKSTMTFRERYALFPFAALMARHYFMIGKKISEKE